MTGGGCSSSSTTKPKHQLAGRRSIRSPGVAHADASAWVKARRVRPDWRAARTLECAAALTRRQTCASAAATTVASAAPRPALRRKVLFGAQLTDEKPRHRGSVFQRRLSTGPCAELGNFQKQCSAGLGRCAATRTRARQIPKRTERRARTLRPRAARAGSVGSKVWEGRGRRRLRAAPLILGQTRCGPSRLLHRPCSRATSCGPALASAAQRRPRIG